MSISILSLGWEFPPNVWGGLGVAYTALNDELSKHTSITAFIPHPQELEEIPVSPEPPAPVQTTYSIQTQIIPSSSYTYTTYSYEVVRIPVPKIIDPYTGATSLYQQVTTIPKQTVEEVPIPETEINVIVETTEKPPSSNEPAREFPSYSELQNFTNVLLEQPLFRQVYQYAIKALEQANDLSFDLIHAHDWMTSLAGVEIKHKYQRPLIIHVHSLEYDRNGLPKESWIYDLERMLYHQADALVAVSSYTKNILIEQYQIPEEKVYVIPNGIEPLKTERKKKAFPETLILFLGRLTYQKAPELFVQIAERIISQNPNTRFVLGGKGEKITELIQQTARAKIGDRVHFTGHLDREKVHQLLAMTDIFVMPSISEPFGLVALEAAQFNIPCILSKYSGASEVLPSAFIADPHHISEWIDIILTLSKDSELRANTATKQLKDLEWLTWDRAASQLAQLMEEVMNENVEVV